MVFTSSLTGKKRLTTIKPEIAFWMKWRDTMRLTDNGKICVVNAKEQRRQEKWKKQQERKQKSGRGSA